jgi:hypothetical protein
MLTMNMVVWLVNVGQDGNCEDSKTETDDGNGEQSETGEAN